MPGFEDTIEALAAHQRLKPSQMRQLSGLASEQLRQLRGVWSKMPDPERMNLLAGLRRHAENDTLSDFDAIYDVAMDDPNGDVRRVAVSAIVGDQNLNLMSKLLDLCASDPDEMVRATAAERLGSFAYEAEVGTLPAETAVRIQEVLLGRAQSETEALGVRAQALASAGYFSTEEVRNEIRLALTRAGLRVAAIRAIGRNLDPEWTPVLVDQMGSEDAVIRQEAAAAAADYEDAVDALSDLVDDPVIAVQLAAISSLGKIGGTEAKDVLIYCFESGDSVIKKAATAALREIETLEAPLATAGPERDDAEVEEEDDEESQ
jgi:HEAT repeat protein